MKKRKTRNQKTCEYGRAVTLEKGEMWGTEKTMLYSIEIKNKVFYKHQSVVLGIFETEKERDIWFLEWERKIKTYQKNQLPEL